MDADKLHDFKEEKFKRQIQYQVQVNIDQILKQIQNDDVKYKNERLNITQKEFITLCRQGRNLLLRQASLLKLNGPIFIATGTVGYYRDLVNITARCGHPSFNNYLFLGDYIGRGDRNIECLVFLISFKLKFPNNFFLLRGCLDSIAMSRSYQFYDECNERYSPKAWSEACQFLCSLPFAAIIQNQIFCCHGGLSPQLRFVDQINKIPRPIETPQVGLLCDLVWSDVSYKQDSLIWSRSQRGFGFCFHEKAVKKFLWENRLSMVIRGHEVVYDGFYINKDRTLGTICSLANYGGIFNNSAAVYVINFQMQGHFKVIRQRQHFPIETFSSENANSLLKKVMFEKREKKRKEQKLQKEKEEEEKIKRLTETKIEGMNERQSKQQDEALAFTNIPLKWDNCQYQKLEQMIKERESQNSESNSIQDQDMQRKTEIGQLVLINKLNQPFKFPERYAQEQGDNDTEMEKL